MSSTPPPGNPPPGGFLGRLKGLVESLGPTEEAGAEVPLATPVPADTPQAPAVPVATPLATASPVEATPAPPNGAGPAESPAEAEEAPAPASAPVVLTCAVCGSARKPADDHCSDCGYYYPPGDVAAATNGAPSAPKETALLQGRYQLGELLGERQGVVRYRARDLGDGTVPPKPVVVVAQALPPALVAAEPVVAVPVTEDDEEILPTFDDVLTMAAPVTDVISSTPTWPSVAWERKLLRTLELSALPLELDYFTTDTHEYLVEEVPTGRSLWDAADDPDATFSERFGYLVEVAELVHRLHQCNAMVEGLRPDLFVIGDDGHVRLADLGDLLPLPLPPGAPVRGGLYTAPELMTGSGQADARSDLYSFGAMLYALHVGRELNERTDFDKPGHPKPFIPRFPDIHPAYGRLMMKTFRREVDARFPTDEARKEDASGFVELIRTLEVLRRTFDDVRLEIASWTTTGIVRTGNEDAFALLHATESRQDDLSDSALVLLCDGMGGYEAGEVAAAMTLQFLRQNLTKQKPFAHLGGGPCFPTDPQAQTARAEGHAGPPLDVEEAKKLIKAALREANKAVFTASRAPGSKRRGMGCTAEVVYVDGRNIVVGHVGDSRTYHLREGNLIQLTRDQTLVNRLVELGTLTAEEAEKHPRRNELQQAIGGQPDVEPGVYSAVLKPGDWVVVCSDGLTNHVTSKDLEQMLRSEAASAEMAARRLVNLTNIEGATDNTTVVVIRAT